MTPKPPTAKQQSYLRALAERTGQTFTPPKTIRDASHEIQRLKATPRTPRVERQIERDDQASANRARAAGCSVPHTPGDVHGYGSTATWTHNQPPDEPADRPATPPRPTVPMRELARYTANAQDRILYGQRVDGNARLLDRPAGGRGRAYLVEDHLELDGADALTALIADYLAQAQQLDVIPAGYCPLERYLEALA